MLFKEGEQSQVGIIIVKENCDVRGFCNKYFKEYKLEYKGKSGCLILMQEVSADSSQP